MDEEQLECTFNTAEEAPVAQDAELFQHAATDIRDIGDIDGAMPRMVAKTAFRREPQGFAGDDEPPYGVRIRVRLVKPEATALDSLAGYMFLAMSIGEH